MTTPPTNSFAAIAWCLAWGDELNPRPEFQALRDALKTKQVESKQASLSEQSQQLLQRVRSLQSIDPTTDEMDEKELTYPRTLEALKQQYNDLYSETTSIGLVLGGATKIKQYVFESEDLQDIRGASALLDRINLIDLKAFFNPDLSSPFAPGLSKPSPI